MLFFGFKDLCAAMFDGFLFSIYWKEFVQEFGVKLSVFVSGFV